MRTQGGLLSAAEETLEDEVGSGSGSKKFWACTRLSASSSNSATTDDVEAMATRREVEVGERGKSLQLYLKATVATSQSLNDCCDDVTSKKRCAALHSRQVYDAFFPRVISPPC
ncbi:hypothetical protein J6590_047298 [Homalodisca vitripennis]|nr:hypothetical protein J6590_047298 [Homalodisca vitripennis]